MKKLLEILSFYTCVPKTTVPEIRSETDRMFCPFGPFFALLTPNNPKNQNFHKMKKRLEILSFERYYHFMRVYHKLQSYDVCFWRYRVWQTEFFVILDHFLPFYPHNNPKNQNFDKMKKTLGDIIILHMCTIYENHMIYVSSAMERERHNFFLNLDHVLPFYPPNNPENENFGKMKKTPGNIIILHSCTINYNHMVYGY